MCHIWKGSNLKDSCGYIDFVTNNMGGKCLFGQKGVGYGYSNSYQGLAGKSALITWGLSWVSPPFIHQPVSRSCDPKISLGTLRGTAG